MNLKKIRVLVVDDSAVVRQMIADALSKDPEIEVVGKAADPYVAREKILGLNPDVITLDVEMPKMDGITFLKILMKHHPLPVIIISSLTQGGSAKAVEAVEAGAVDVLAKPNSAYSIGDLGEQLPSRVKAAAAARLSNLFCRSEREAEAVPSSRAVGVCAKHDPRQIILLGASTGGTEALKEILVDLPDTLPGICVVQHIPAYFSKAFAERLDQLCQMEVREAKDGDRVERGLALIAPGGYHMLLNWIGENYHVLLKQGPPVHFQRPAVDVLFNSAAQCAGKHAIAAVLTGMGKDGAEGLKRLKEAGARTIAQSEESCVVYGMPRAAVELGAADQVVHLHSISSRLVQLVEEENHRVKPL